MLSRPFPNSYWVVPGQFLAGEYPYAADSEKGREKVISLLKAGVRQFIDLTRPGEYGLLPYHPTAVEEAAQLGLTIEHVYQPIRDMGTPEIAEMAHTLATIEQSIQSGKPVYVHCYGGRGRTGTVVGCYLVQHGMNGEDALDQIRTWRNPTPDGIYPSPETLAQQMFVLNWVPIQLKTTFS
jgi:hypothetical protein